MVEEVNRFAFGQENEARLVANLRRSPSFIPDLSLVAENDGTIVGHSMFTHIAIVRDAVEVPTLALAPTAGSLDDLMGTVRYPPVFDDV